eukprot:TRINITY_DN8656_c0_g1_i1.p1 TRINITY_DN8656_c0_g1~~TRINITY_DN8656_c0_g1_i1.p1  ORF type:complete len:654 (+),score=157.92 TRINITY_DN8656_c0_g1_i1:218-2179(+)
MKLTVEQQPTNKHQGLCTGVAWNPQNECFSTGDDRLVHRWSSAGEPQGKLTSIPENVMPTDMQWFPSYGRQQSAATDVFVLGATDGKFRLVTKSGRIEKLVEAHRGSLTALRWSFDGTALATAGEDGIVKIWSRSGMLRSTLTHAERAVYGIAWGPDNNQILYTAGKNLVIKPLQPSSKPIEWTAHDALILAVDWNPVNTLICSGGEDCKYRIWDSFGRQLYTSNAYDHPTTSIRWCPDGELLAVGSFNSLRLCDRTGWCYCMERPETGSIFKLAWTTDGTELAAAGGNGAVAFAHLVDRRVSFNNLECVLEDANKIVVQDVTTLNIETLEFRDRVIKMSIAFNHLIVATATQCCIYSVTNWGAPHIFDLKDPVNLIVQSSKYFLMSDNSGVNVYNYEGRVVSSPKFQGLATEFMNKQSISLSDDAVAIIDTADHKVVRVFDVTTGKQLASSIKHALDCVEIALDQHGQASERKLAIIDKNRDLSITPIHSQKLVKLGAMVDTCMWNDATGMLAAFMDGNFVVWTYPNVVYVDRDLLKPSTVSKSGHLMGKNPHLVSFVGTHCTFRRTDGALVSASVSPYPAILYEHSDKGEWDHAVRLCRFVKDKSLWAVLAAIAVNANELNTAEVAFAAIDEVDKLQCMSSSSFSFSPLPP